MEELNELPPCAEDIFRSGKPVAFLNGKSAHVEAWVKEVAAEAYARVDWHYSGGVAQVLFLGDSRDRARVIAVMNELAPMLQGTVLQVLTEDVPGLYRAGVTDAPEGTVAAYYDGGTMSRYIKGD